MTRSAIPTSCGVTGSCDLKIQRRALVRVPGRERTWNVGKVLRVDSIERMQRWSDEKGHDPINYLLDLQLPT